MNEIEQFSAHEANKQTKGAIEPVVNKQLQDVFKRIRVAISNVKFDVKIKDHLYPGALKKLKELGYDVTRAGPDSVYKISWENPNHNGSQPDEDLRNQDEAPRPKKDPHFISEAGTAKTGSDESNLSSNDESELNIDPEGLEAEPVNKFNTLLQLAAKLVKDESGSTEDPEAGPLT